MPSPRRGRWAAALAAAVLLVAPAGARAAAPPAAPLVHPEVPVTPVFERAGFAHNSPDLAVDPTDPDVMVAASRLDGPEFGCALHLSGDGGRSWLPMPLPELPEGAERCYAPEVAFAPDGTLHLLFLGLAGKGNSPVGAYLTAARKGGFGAARRVLGPDRYMVRMEVDRRSGRMHLVWLEAGADPPLGGLPAVPNPIMAARSDDGGRTFSSPVQVSDPARSRVVAPALAIGEGGAVHVAYYDLVDDARDYQGLDGPTWEGTWSLVVSSSFDGGATFGRHQVVDDALVPPERVMLIFTMPPPALAVAGDGVVAAWHDARHGDWDAFVSASGDGGGTWAGPARLNDDEVGHPAHQYLPRLAVAPDGRVDAVFYDRRADPDNRRNDVWFASSRDGGRTFGANVRLTTEGSDSRIGPRYAVPSARGLVEPGSRLGLVSLPGRAVAAWADMRNSPVDSNQQDVFATTVDLEPAAGGGAPATGGRWGALPAVAGAGAALALAAAALVWRRRRHSSGGEAG